MWLWRWRNGFWDIIYNPTSKTNEEESAEATRRMLTNAQVSSSFIDKVDRLVMVTKTHQPGNDIYERIMADIDILILGAHPVIYEEYKDNIRKEYSEFPLYEYKRGRLHVLQSLLGRLEYEELYHIPMFRYKYEESTRYNLSREIAELERMKIAVDAGSFDPPH